MKEGKSMLRGDLPPSQQVRDMISMTTPCDNIVYYPANLAILGTQGKYSLFMTLAHESGIAYLCITQPDRVKFRIAGDPMKISVLYGNAPWKEVQITEGNGVFFYKIAPSLQELEEYVNSL
jgi:hypothetical protein